MIVNPPNPRPELPNRHTLAIGLTGSGKSQVMKQKAPIPKSGARVVLFDPSRDHSKGVHYYSNRAQFARALIEANARGKGFRIGYDGVRSPEIYDWWCGCCIALLDGKKELYMMTEELAGVSLHSGRAMTNHRFLLNESRKYGGVYCATTQFPARISKDVYDNAGTIFFGKTAPRLQSQFSADFGLEPVEFKNLQNLEFLRWEGGKVDFMKINYQKNS